MDISGVSINQNYLTYQIKSRRLSYVQKKEKVI